MAKASILVLSGHVGNAPDYIFEAKKNHQMYCEIHGYDYYFENNPLSYFSQEEISKNENLHFYWLKVLVVKKFLSKKKYSHVFWIDSDSIFFDELQSLEDLINRDTDLVLSGDAWDIFNTGHFLMKNSEWSHTFLEKWLSLYGESVSQLNTTHKTSSGKIFEQPAAAMLLAGGFTPVENLENLFNSINGYSGNHKRKHRLFWLFYAPTRNYRVFFSKKLISRDLRPHISVVPQWRLNSYPFRLPGAQSITKKSKILHFVGDTKDQLTSYC